MIKQNGGQAIAVVGDILDDAYQAELVKRAAEFGNGKIHVLVNNAGFTWDGVIHKVCPDLCMYMLVYRVGMLTAQMTDKQWETMLAIHNTAPFKLVRAAAPYFRVKDGEDRVVVNISSTSGIHGNAFVPPPPFPISHLPLLYIQVYEANELKRGQANYAVAKAGIVGLTKTIAKEWGPGFGVRANTIAFGFVQTRLTAAKEDGAFVTTPDGTKVPLGIPGKQLQSRAGAPGAQAKYPDIPLGRPASPLEAARAVLAVASPLFSYVSGETIRVTGGRNM